MRVAGLARVGRGACAAVRTVALLREHDFARHTSSAGENNHSLAAVGRHDKAAACSRRRARRGAQGRAAHAAAGAQAAGAQGVAHGGHAEQGGGRRVVHRLAVRSISGQRVVVVRHCAPRARVVTPGSGKAFHGRDQAQEDGCQKTLGRKHPRVQRHPGGVRARTLRACVHGKGPPRAPFAAVQPAANMRAADAVRPATRSRTVRTPSSRASVAACSARNATVTPARGFNKTRVCFPSRQRHHALCVASADVAGRQVCVGRP